jgi:polysaccharide pyruvyl transferase WcaK-like protein
MDRSVALVLKGFTELNTAQRQEFITEINKYIEGQTQEQPLQKSIRESVYGNAINFGPAPTGCPCCGK